MPNSHFLLGASSWVGAASDPGVILRCKRSGIISWSSFGVSSRVLVIVPPVAQGQATKKGGTMG
jgi:hypothetical protein